MNAVRERFLQRLSLTNGNAKDTKGREKLELVDTTEIESYTEIIAEKIIMLKGMQKSLSTARFIGKYSSYIEKALQPEFSRLNGTTMMAHVLRVLGEVTTRGPHIYNAAELATKIAMGIFEDEEIAKGIGVATVIHDIGQPSLGHEGEDMSSNVSESQDGGPRPHNATGASQLLFRKARKINRAFNTGIRDEILAREAKKRDISIEMLEKSMTDGNEKELEDEIKRTIEEVSELKKEAIRMMVTAAGRHNGERAIPDIIPDYNRSFEEFFEVLQKCFVRRGADKEMISANMIDAIVKIADQISSIPFDMIDGMRSGMFAEIPKEYSISVSGILGISQEEALRRIRSKNSSELVALVQEIQEKIVEDIIENSTKRGLHMSRGLEYLVYGKGEEANPGMREVTQQFYYDFTTNSEEAELMQRAWAKAAELIANTIVIDGEFPREINRIFILSENDSRREPYLRTLKSAYKGKPEFADFFNYVCETLPEEYQFIKGNLRQTGLSLLRANIASAKKEYNAGTTSISSIEKTMKDKIVNYLNSPWETIPDPKDGKEYTDQEVEDIYQRISVMRGDKSPLLIPKDKRIAIQLALGYIEEKFHDRALLEFFIELEVLTPEEAKKVATSYIPVTEEELEFRRKNKYVPDVAKRTRADGADAVARIVEI